MSDTTNLQLRSLVQDGGTLTLSLHNTPMPSPASDEVLIRVEASPLNPSDIGLLFGAADIRTAAATGTADNPAVTMQIASAAMKSMAGRLGQSMPVGNEGAGTVVAAGASSAAQALMGKMVAVLGGAMYTQYRCVKAEQCLELPTGTSAAQGASCFVNPLTALGFVETMRHEGHSAIVHTAAASNLGQMLQRICTQDSIALVNIVRKPEQEALLRAMGASYVCNSESPSFLSDLTAALVATGATLAFDATGGGQLAGQILGCMEAALGQKSSTYSRYGSATHKQVYLYGGLDTSATSFNRNFGMAWGMGGWLVFSYLQKFGPEKMQSLRARVVAELHTTFSSHYSKEVSLQQALLLDEIVVYGQRSTATKYLINPALG